SVFVADTHGLVYYLDQKLTRLGRNARRAFQSAAEGSTLIYIPTVVLWEMSRRLAEGELVFSKPFDEWCRGVDTTTGFSILPLEWQDVSQARSFPFKDPFDCLIAGTAVRLGVPLITKDTEIRDSGLIQTIW